MYDVIVIGAGHNGLACGAYLAKAHKRVLVLEANPVVGGFVTTADVPGAPGFRMNPYAIEFPFEGANPRVSAELGLARFGLRWVLPDPHQTHMALDGEAFSLHHDLRRTCASIERLSAKDARSYGEMMSAIIDVLQCGLPYLQDHPTRPSARTIATIAKRAAKNRKQLLPGIRFLLSSPQEVLARFEREEVRAFLGMNTATGAFRPLDEPANMSAFVYFALMHMYPLHRPVGGSGAYTQALADCVRSHGGEVRISAPVAQIVVRNGKATGVVLANGEELRSAQVVSAADPTSLFTKLLPRDAVDPEVRAEVERLQITANNVSHVKIDLAVSERLKFTKPGIGPEHFGGGMSFAPSYDHADRSLKAVLRGELSDDLPFFYIATPSVLDRSMVPAGSAGDSVFVWIGAVPHSFADGRTWSDEKPKFFDRVIDHLELFVPDIRETIIGSHMAAPGDFNEPWAFKGSARGVDVVPSQMGPWRPSPSLAAYKTTVDDLWHTGHGAHPMSGTSGWPGRIAARTILKQK